MGAAAAKLPAEFKVRVRGCARCGQDHEVQARAFRGEPIEKFNAWAPCPDCGDPILIAVEKDNPKQAKETKAMVKQTDPHEAAALKRIEREKVAEADRFLEDGVRVGEEIKAALMHISEEMQEILEGPLTEEALLILIQARAGNARNGHPYGFEVIRAILKALATLDQFVVRR